VPVFWATFGGTIACSAMADVEPVTLLDFAVKVPENPFEYNNEWRWGSP
jgi:hypothetical protein